MNQKLIQQLNQLNTDFYDSTAISFNESRQYYWEGWEKIPPLFDNFSEMRAADIGCGNGRFGQFLLDRCPNIKLSYTGIDSNQKLLQIAEQKLQGKIPALYLETIDVVTQLLNKYDFLGNQQFQAISCFGVFHHIPSFQLRQQLFSYLFSKLTIDGSLIVSFWQFMNFDRFRKKTIIEQSELSELGYPFIDLKELEKNDYILDWLRGTKAVRYCHFIDEEEQDQLITLAGARAHKAYLADGKEGTVNKYYIVAK